MNTNAFERILKQQLSRRSGGRPQSQQQAELEISARGKQFDLEKTLRLRTRKGGNLSEEDAEAVFMASSTLVDQILSKSANEDIETLTNQEYFRMNKKSTTSVGSDVNVFRDKSGRIMSPGNVESALNLSLYRYAQEHMGVNGQLKWRTGRLAHSGTVTGVEVNRDTRQVSIFYTYMLYPYEVFENQRATMGNGGRRSPVRLFDDAIRSALDGLLAKKTLDELMPGMNISHRRDRV